MMRIFILISVTPPRSIKVVRELIGAEKTAKIEELAIALYTKVPVLLGGIDVGRVIRRIKRHYYSGHKIRIRRN
jgi:hypothetical protein